MACRCKKIRDVQIGYSLDKARYIFDTGSAVILRRCYLGDRACVSNFAHASTRRRGHSRGRPRRGSGQASERKPDEKEAHREVDTRARNPENRGNAGLSCDRMLASRACQYPTYIYICSYTALFVFPSATWQNLNFCLQYS